MSNIDYIHEEQAADIGNFLVGRLLPFRQKRSIGPFVFIDHMVPACLVECSVLHRYCSGTAMENTPGASTWMTARKGVVHSERTPEHLRTRDKFLHGIQICVALPKELEFMQPEFFHVEARDIPSWK